MNFRYMRSFLLARVSALRGCPSMRNSSRRLYSCRTNIKNIKPYFLTRFSTPRHYLETIVRSHYSSKEVPKITSEEYDIFTKNGTLRQLNSRTLISANLCNVINTSVTIIGWIERGQNDMFLVDGYGKTICLIPNDNVELQNAISNFKPNEVIGLKGLVGLQKQKDITLTIEDIVPLTKDHSDFNSKKVFLNSFTYRTHMCGEIRPANVGENVTICGWLQYQRLSKFLLLRDSSGSVQCLLPESLDITTIPLESILKVKGTVALRPPSMVNLTMSTGEIELIVDNFELINLVDKIPFTLRKHQKPKEQLRLQHRYIDLRFPEMQNNLRLRSQWLHRMRRFLIEQHSFVEVETPTLFCRTPGGAREFVVPTRHRGLFYSLVQSPQQFKQMLMVGGIDRYFQIARCYRDETTRPDRQPEFTQLDIELSFTSIDGIFNLIEQLIYDTYPLPIMKPPFQRIKYREALETYGCDKPNITYDMKFQKITSILENTNSINGFGAYGIVLPDKYLKTTNRLKESIRELNGRYKNVKIYDKHRFFNESAEDVTKKISAELNSKDAMFFVSIGPNDEACQCLGELRILLAEELTSKGLLKVNSMYKPLWIVDFPLFLKGANGLETCHHPFTAPHPDDLHLLETDPLKVRSLAYDLVMNGNELGGGSIRIHNADLQIKLLEMLKIDLRTMEHFIKALRSGCPPHGGIALGIDRMMAQASNADSIRDVIAFPKSHEGKDPLSGAPNVISDDDKLYYNIAFEDVRNKAKL